MADIYTLAVRQRTVRQETAVVKTGTLPHYLYSEKISDVAETTEAYSADMVRSSDVEKEVPNVTEQRKVPKVDSAEEEQADLFDSASEEEDDLLPASTSNVVRLDFGSLFLVGCSSKSGR